MGRILGIDYGVKRVGLAMTDESQMMAFPKEVLPNNDELFEQILKICKDNQIEKIVLGESKNFKMKANKIMEEIIPFKTILENKSGLPVIFELEFLTSFQVEKAIGKNDMLDASAATIILQAYLDRGVK
jgi:putative Holliday junction resolvase